MVFGLLPEGEPVFEGVTEDGPVSSKLSEEPVDDEPEFRHENASPCPFPHSIFFWEMLHSMSAYQWYAKDHRNRVKPVETPPFCNLGLEQRKVIVLLHIIQELGQLIIFLSATIYI